MVKINLGCGPVGKDDWVNVDWGVLAFLHKFPAAGKVASWLRLLPQQYQVAWPKNLILHNCKKGLPFQSGSVDYIYTSHMIEHFRKFEALKVLIESLRILKTGGIVRVVVPDFELLVRKYLEKDAGYFKMINQLVNASDAAPALLLETLQDILYPRSHKVRLSFSSTIRDLFVRPHLWMYDYESLGALLREAGFTTINGRSFREGQVPDLDVLDKFPELSLYVEAEK